MGMRPPHRGFRRYSEMLGEEIPERTTPSRILIRRLLKYFLPYKKHLTIVLLAIVATSITGAISPYLLGRQIISTYILTGDFAGLQLMVLAYIGVTVINWAAGAARTFSIGKIGESMLFKMRSDLFSHIQELSFTFFDRSDSGDTISRVTNDTDSIGEAFTSGAVSVIGDVLSLALVIIVMFTMSAQLAIVTMAVVPLVAAAAWAFNSKFRSAYRATRTKISDVTSKLEQSISGIREIQSFTREADTMRDFSAANLQNFQANVQATKIWGFFFPTIQIIQAVGTSIVMIYGGWLAFNGGLGPEAEAVGTLIAFLFYVQQFFGPIFDLTNFYNTVQAALAAAERIFNLIDTKPEIIDSEEAAEMPQIKGEIIFDNVTFGYVPEHPVLHNVSFHVMPEQTIALVGPTGAGKSTIIKLLSRFYEPQFGIITIDAYEVRSVRQTSLRSQMGIVLQDSFLFTGTITENIRYGKLDATDEEVMDAAKIVGAHDFISALPDGYNTEIGERGAGLSVGQKQLVSFARALLRNPAILILDEATSSIDPYTDLLIRKAMDVLLKDRTSVIIAHRLSTVRNADRILVIDDGRIIEEGNHRELMKREGIYSRLYEMQFKEPEEEKPETPALAPVLVQNPNPNPADQSRTTPRGVMSGPLQNVRGIPLDTIEKFRRKAALSPDTAMTAEELGLPPQFKTMMNRQLGKSGIFIEVNGKYYLSEKRLQEIGENLRA